MKRTPLVVMPWRDIFHVECTPQMCGEDDCICDYLAGYIPPRYPLPTKYQTNLAANWPEACKQAPKLMAMLVWSGGFNPRLEY